MKKGESGTNNLLDQQISAYLRRLLVWHSGDYDGIQSQRSRVQIQMSAKKKTGGLHLRLGLESELGGSMGLGLGMGLDVWLGGSIGLGIGMGLDVGLGIGMGLGLVVGVLFFLRNTPSPQKSEKLPSWKKLTS